VVGFGPVWVCEFNITSLVAGMIDSFLYLP
jgi:hypothetical protein